MSSEPDLYKEIALVAREIAVTAWSVSIMVVRPTHRLSTRARTDRLRRSGTHTRTHSLTRSRPPTYLLTHSLTPPHAPPRPDTEPRRGRCPARPPPTPPLLAAPDAAHAPAPPHATLLHMAGSARRLPGSPPLDPPSIVFCDTSRSLPILRFSSNRAHRLRPPIPVATVTHAFTDDV